MESKVKWVPTERNPLTAPTLRTREASGPSARGTSARWRRPTTTRRTPPSCTGCTRARERPWRHAHHPPGHLNRMGRPLAFRALDISGRHNNSAQSQEVMSFADRKACGSFSPSTAPHDAWTSVELCVCAVPVAAVVHLDQVHAP